MEERAKPQDWWQREQRLRMHRYGVKYPFSRILEHIDYCDVEMYISPNSDSFSSVYTAHRMPVIVSSVLHVLAHLIKFPLSFVVSRFTEFSPQDF